MSIDDGLGLASPEGLGPDGRRLWNAVTGECAMEEHELVLLRQAVRVADMCADLQALVDAQGLMLGDRIHPASVELRQQRLLLGRLIVALRIPVAQDDEGTPEAVPDGQRTQRRGLRGPYQPRGLYPVEGGA
jgi:hypothetical protein